MKIQQSKGGSWDKDLIDEMRNFEFCKTENIYKLKHQLKTFIYFFSIVLGKDLLVVNQLSILINKVEMNETTFIENFDRYASFVIKFFYQVDRFLKQFLSSCSNVSDVEDVDFYLINISHIHLSVMRQQFFCALPISFSVNKITHDHSQHGPNTKSKKGDHRVIKNESPNIACKFKNNEAYCP